MTTLQLPPYPLAEFDGPGADGDPDEVLLVVADWQSRCTGCGGGATTTESAHSTRMPEIGLAQLDRGCGRRYTAVAVAIDATMTIGVAAVAIARDLGLPFVGHRPMPRRGGVA